MTELQLSEDLLRKRDYNAAWPLLVKVYRESDDPLEIAAALNNAGQLCEMLFTDEGDERALNCYVESLRYFETSMALCNYGQKAKDIGRFDDAYCAFTRAVELDPSNDLARFRLALILLAFGEFESGWEAYEARLSLNWQSIRSPVSSLKRNGHPALAHAGPDQPLPGLIQSPIPKKCPAR